MTCLDPGHLYEVKLLDTKAFPYLIQRIQFVKREGKNYPGNKNTQPGTTTQELLRVCCDRLRYVNNQKPHVETIRALRFCQEAIMALENRAAEIYGRNQFIYPEDTEFGNCCYKCNHVDCSGNCHK